MKIGNRPANLSRPQAEAAGAFYTGSDITAYIAQATILPFLLDSVRQHCPEDIEIEQGGWDAAKRSEPARRDSIFLGKKVGAECAPAGGRTSPARLYHATRLHRWFDAAPPNLFALLD